MNEELNRTIPKDGIPADGLYNAPTNITGYDTIIDGVNSTPYNETLIGDSSNNLVGTSTNPYLPAILPVYIPTLYENIYSIQTNLVNNLSVNFENTRQYPTAKAVKDYVASQFAGFELLTEGKVSTTKTTSILAVSTNSDNRSTTTLNGKLITKYSYEINPIDTSRNGAGKVIICNATLSDTATMTLSAGSNAKFYALGKSYTNYQFAIQGDTIDMIQFIDESNGNSNNFLVKSFGGKFYN